MTPVLDECRGHFGPVSDDSPGEVVYHYHAQDVVNQVSGGDGFHAYYLGCQGPARGRCLSQVNWTAYDMGHVYCDDGCGAEVCVQPSVTKKAALAKYLGGFSNKTWLSGYTTNVY